MDLLDDHQTLKTAVLPEALVDAPLRHNLPQRGGQGSHGKAGSQCQGPLGTSASCVCWCLEKRRFDAESTVAAALADMDLPATDDLHQRQLPLSSCLAAADLEASRHAFDRRLGFREELAKGRYPAAAWYCLCRQLVLESVRGSMTGRVSASSTVRTRCEVISLLPMLKLLLSLFRTGPCLGMVPVTRFRCWCLYSTPSTCRRPKREKSKRTVQ